MEVLQTSEILIIQYDSSWQNDIETYQELIKTYHVISKSDYRIIHLEMGKVEFVAANLFAVLGGMFYELGVIQRRKIGFLSLRNKIKAVMQKNGFGNLFNLGVVLDKYHTTIEYHPFRADTIELEQFEKYIFFNIFEHRNMPEMSVSVRDVMIDNFLEMFNNVIDHAGSEFVHVCGQFFPRKKRLVLSIVDFGTTIRDNIEIYNRSILMNEKCSLKWAIAKGNSTKTDDAPGGLGFSLILDFLEQNRGEFVLISGREYFCKDHNGKKFLLLEESFPGTIVTITFNMDDEFSYILVNKDIELIKF